MDLFGQMAAIECLQEMIPHLPIVEDAAQTIGARRRIGGKDRMAGEVATIGTFSFFPSKNLGGYGDGGMMVTQDDALAERLRRLRVHGGLKTYYHDEVGYNSRLDTLQAAVLRAKLPHLERWSDSRRANADVNSAGMCCTTKLGFPGTKRPMWLAISRPRAVSTTPTGSPRAAAASAARKGPWC